MIYYCILKNSTLHLVSESYYKINRKDLTAIAVGTVDEIIQFLIDLDIINKGDDIDGLD